jgi:hypothetical protein
MQRKRSSDKTVKSKEKNDTEPEPKLLIPAKIYALTGDTSPNTIIYIN